MFSIRTAQEHDAGKLAALAETTFRDTFGASNTGENMDRHCAHHYSESIQRKEILNADSATLVCEHDGELIAYAQLRWQSAPSCVNDKSAIEIQRLYVDKAWHGKGLAQLLMEKCLTFAAERGSTQVWLGVWEQNPRAIAFYKKFEFAEVGEHIFALGSDPQRDIIMVRAL